MVFAIAIIGVAVPFSRPGALLIAGLPIWFLVVASWNILGFVFLVNIVTVAIVSTPVFGWFGVDRLNTFVTYPPFVWLPAILVTAALIGHVLVWCWLSSRPSR